LARRSEGHPLFLAELLRDDPEQTLETPGSSGGIADVVAARLERCSADARLLAEIAAVCGSTFDLDLLGRAAGWDDGSLIDALAELLSRQFIRSTASDERGSYAFGHALVHAAILARVDERDRQRLHRVIARALESRAAGQRYDAEIARHWFAAGDGARAGAAYARAADASLRVYARDESAQLATLGLACTADPHLRGTLLNLRIAANRRHAPLGVLRADIAQVREIAHALGDDARFDAARLAFDVELESDELGAIEAAEALREFIDTEGFPLRSAIIAEALARSNGRLGNHGLALAAADAALDGYARCAAAREEIAMAIFIVRIKSEQGNIDEALALLERIEPRVTSLNDPAIQIDHGFARIGILHVQRSGRAYLEECRRLIELTRAVGDRLSEGRAIEGRSAAYSHLCELGNALRDCDAALDIYAALGVAGKIEKMRNNRASVLFEIGRIAESSIILRDLYASSSASGMTKIRYFAASNLGCVMLAAGHVDEALDLQREALALARQMESEGFAALALGDLGAAEIAAGDASAGLTHLHEAIAINRKLNRVAVLAHDLARAPAPNRRRSTARSTPARRSRSSRPIARTASPWRRRSSAAARRRSRARTTERPRRIVACGAARWSPSGSPASTKVTARFIARCRGMPGCSTIPRAAPPSRYLPLSLDRARSEVRGVGRSAPAYRGSSPPPRCEVRGSEPR
jgi:tetratricopeptide (TPR) repeat protein